MGELKHKNVTLSLPEPLLRRFRVYAAQNDRSMTSLMAEAIGKMLDEGGEYEKAQRRFVKRMREAQDRGTGGVFDWTREDLHER